MDWGVVYELRKKSRIMKKLVAIQAHKNPLKKSPSYDIMTENGAHWGENWGMEVPIYFAKKGFKEKPSLHGSNAFNIVAEEC